MLNLFNFRGRFRMTKNDFHRVEGRRIFFSFERRRRRSEPERIITYKIYIERGLVEFLGKSGGERALCVPAYMSNKAISLNSTHVFACDKEQVKGIFESVETRRRRNQFLAF